MGDSRSVAWLVLVAGCSAAPPTPPGGACRPTASSSSALHLVAISPDVVPLHGGDVELSFEGAMPSGQPIYVNGAVAALDGATLHVPPSVDNSPLSIRIGDDPGHPVASLECAGHYAESPDSVELSQVPAGLAVPLHPELAHECARAGYVQIANTGDEPFVIFPELTGSPAFSPYFPPDACPLPMYFDSCEILMCFSSNITMTHQAHLVIPSTVTNASLDFTATVLPPTPGLDLALWRPYATMSKEQVRGVTALPAGAVAVWDESPALAFEIVTASGETTQHATPSAILTMRAGAGIYAIVGDITQHALIHFDDSGNRDTAFGQLALAIDSTAVQVQSGRALVIGNATVTAVLASGAIDTTFGNKGVMTFSGPFTGASALDGTGRLYVATPTGVIRILASGAIDQGFNYSGAITALTLSGGSPIVAAGGVIARLDESGAATVLPLSAPQLARPIIDLGADASGQLYLITDDSQLLRFAAAGQFDGVRGFEGAHRLACPASGDCAVVGLSNGLDKYLLELAP
jgi:hypothetical protein